MAIRNLLTETKNVLEANSKSFEDIVWIGNDDYRITLEEFIILADFDYDAGYGTENIKMDLKIVGEDWYLTRGSYDGMEWWRYNTIPPMPTEFRSPTTLKTKTAYGTFMYLFEEEDYV